jgi:hypothetical protein
MHDAGTHTAAAKPACLYACMLSTQQFVTRMAAMGRACTETVVHQHSQASNAVRTPLAAKALQILNFTQCRACIEHCCTLLFASYVQHRHPLRVKDSQRMRQHLFVSLSGLFSNKQLHLQQSGRNDSPYRTPTAPCIQPKPS